MAEVSWAIIEHHHDELNKLQLDENTNANKYINRFIICSNKLEDKAEGDSLDTKRSKFLDQIINDDYDVVVQQLWGNTMAIFDDCVKRIHSWEQDLLHTQKGVTGKAQCIKDASQKDGSIKKAKILLIPSYILHKVQPLNVKRDLIRWHGIYNSEGRTIHSDELTDAKDKEGLDLEGSKNGTPPTKKGKQTKKWAQHMKMLVSGTKETNP